MDRIVVFAKQWEFPYRDEGIFAFHEGSGVKQSTWMGSKLLRNEYEEGDYEFDNLYEPDRMDDVDIDDEDPPYDSSSTYEYSDYEVDPEAVGDAAQAFDEQMDGDIHSDLAERAVFDQLEAPTHDLEDGTYQQDENDYISPEPTICEEPLNPGVHEQAFDGHGASSQSCSTSALAGDATEAPASYAPPHTVDEGEGEGEVDMEAIDLEEDVDQSQSRSTQDQVQSVTGPLLLESNEQEYYVVSMIFRKRLTDVLTLRGL